MNQQNSVVNVCLSSTKVAFKTSNTTNNNLVKKVALKCPDCGEWMSLREGRYGLSYFCNNFPRCRGSHKASKRGKPLGFPANQETRTWRIKAHKVLEMLYKGQNSLMTKTEAYAFLAYTMGLSKKQAHIAKFTLEQCKEAVEVLDFSF
ncbi:MAG: zinc-finger-containing protein [Blastocatellia bacterium]